MQGNTQGGAVTINGTWLFQLSIFSGEALKGNYDSLRRYAAAGAPRNLFCFPKLALVLPLGP